MIMTSPKRGVCVYIYIYIYMQNIPLKDLHILQLEVPSHDGMLAPICRSGAEPKFLSSIKLRQGLRAIRLFE